MSSSRPPSELPNLMGSMPTDTKRVRRTDPGNPADCPVWQLHEVYSKDEVKDWVQQGCSTAGIGCIDCKGPIIDAVQAELAPIRERAKEFIDQPQLVRNIVAEGSEEARDVARETLNEVRQAMGLLYT